MYGRRRLALFFSRVVRQFIPQRFDRDDSVIKERDLHLQPAYMHVHGSRGPIVVVAPYGIQQDIPCQHTPRVAQQVFEQAELFGRECDLFALHGYFVPGELH